MTAKNFLTLCILLLIASWPALAEKPDIGALWDGDAESFAQLMALYEQDPSLGKEVNKVALKRIFSTWSRSNMENAYAPLRKELERVKSLCAGKPFEQRTHALLFDCCKRADEHLNGAIPDFTYEDLEPGRDPRRKRR